MNVMNFNPHALGEKKLVKLGLRHRKLEIDREEFEKTESEHKALKKAKLKHKKHLLKKGLDPQKIMNSFNVPVKVLKAACI